MKRLKVVLSILMVVLLMVSATSFAAVKPGITYTALGDSIAYGTGGTGGVGYTHMFNRHLERIYGEGAFYNLAADGVTSGDLLAALMAPVDFYGVQAAVEQADVITISIGGNDLLGPFLAGIAEVIMTYYLDGWVIDFEALMADLAAWEADPLSQPQFNAMLYNLSLLFPGLVQGFGNHWADIIDEIRTLNTGADIYVNTVYNPFKFSPALHQFADPFIQGLNTAIVGCASLLWIQGCGCLHEIRGIQQSQKAGSG